MMPMNDSTSKNDIADPPDKKGMQIFGPKDRLVGFKTEASSGPGGIGAILWGMGIAQLRVARHLTNWGIPSLQVKLADRDFSKGHYSHDGVALVRAAMDRLAAQHDIDAFILVANCAFANICLNTAVSDSRISMMALTNPYLTGRQKRELQRWSFAGKIFRKDKWMQLLQGKVDLISSFHSAISMLTGRYTKGLRDDTVSVNRSNPNIGIGNDMILPVGLDKELRSLCDRGVEIYYACSATELGLRYLNKHYRKTLKELQTRGTLTMATIDTDVHLMGTNSEGALMHSDAIRQWLSRSTRLSCRSPDPI